MNVTHMGKSTTVRVWGLAVLLVISLGGASSVAAEHAGDPTDHAGDADGAGEARLRNTLRWSTASEVDNFGFDVFRATKEEGPFERINDEAIPGAGTSDTPSDYVYVDDTIEAGQEYFYYVESISMSGDRERMTPVFRAPPKGEESAPEARPQPGGEP